MKGHALTMPINGIHIKKYHIPLLIIFGNAIIGDDRVLFLELILLALSGKAKALRLTIAGSLILLLHTIPGLLLGTNTPVLFVKQLAGIFISIIFFSSFVDKEEIKDFIAVYYRCCIALAILCILQILTIRLGFRYIYDLSWLGTRPRNLNPLEGRAYGLFSEPTECAFVMMPGIYLSLYRLFGRGRQILMSRIGLLSSLSILAGFLCCRSSTGYITVAFALFIIILEYGLTPRKIIIAVAGVIALVFLVFKVELFRNRIVYAFDMIRDFSPDKVNYYGYSSYAWLLNIKISLKSLLDSFGFGGGLGGYNMLNNKYSYLILASFKNPNPYDANSLFLRIAAELGLPGLMALLVFIRRYGIFKKENNEESPGADDERIYLKIINNLCLVVIFQKLFRMGHYFELGFWLFVILYYYTGVIERKYEECEDYCQLSPAVSRDCRE